LGKERAAVFKYNRQISKTRNTQIYLDLDERNLEIAHEKYVV